MGSGTGVSPDHRATERQIEDELLALVTQLTNEIKLGICASAGSPGPTSRPAWASRPGGSARSWAAARTSRSRTLAALSTALDARFDIELSALKGGDTFTSTAARRPNPRRPGTATPCRGPRTARPTSAVEPGLFVLLSLFAIGARIPGRMSRGIA